MNTLTKSKAIQQYCSFNDFISKHYKKKDVNQEITHTRIAHSSSDLKGGSFHIPDDKMHIFWYFYYRDIVSKGNPDYMTEKQRDSDGPIAVDLDFRFNYNEITTRQYDKEMIEDLVDVYLDELKKIYQFDDETDFCVYILEKPDVNRIEQKKVTKDGIHMLIGIQSDRITQLILRERVMKEISQRWEHFPITNDWESVFDKGISAGTTNWQVYGSRKPENQMYQLTNIFNIKYDTADGEFQRMRRELSTFDISKHIEKLSVRYAEHPSFFFKNDFVAFHTEYKSLKSGKPMLKQPIVTRLQDSNFTDTTISTIRRITNKNEAQFVLDIFLDSIKSVDYELKESYQYAMALPPKYYADGSYDRWVRVGWALKNIGFHLRRNEPDILLIVWVVFSAQSPKFNYRTDIHGLIEKWMMMNPMEKGVSKRSLMYWVKEDAYDKYKEIREKSIDYYIEQSLNTKCPGILSTTKSLIDNDMAEILYQLYKGEYVCADYKNNRWYKFQNHRWVKNDCGVSLSIAISSELKDLYVVKREGLIRAVEATKPEEEPEENPNFVKQTSKKEDEKNCPLRSKLLQIVDITSKLGMNTEKKNIMSQAKEKFWDTDFIKKLDTNPDLICFKNGVVDFKNKQFRPGRPEDYLTLCTHINYIDIDKHREQYAKTIDEINTFMDQLFPEKELCEYMWDHLASTLTGYTNAQTFNMYIGIGRNGKSVLVNLMSKVLGDYKEDAAVSLLTRAPPSAGAATPELMNLRGKRYVVMQEPTKGDRLNDGTMKLFTSGLDPISGRQLYGEQESFYPQMKLVVCSNIMLEVKTDDMGTWRRIRVVPYKSLFTDNPVDNDPEKPYQFKVNYNMTDKFEEWKEVFAAMLVKRVFQTGGAVRDCDIVMAASNKYRESQDYIEEFAREFIVRDPKGKINKTEINSQFRVWYENTYGKSTISPKELHENITKRFGNQKSGVWVGIRIKYERQDLNIPEKEVAVEDDIEVEDL